MTTKPKIGFVCFGEINTPIKSLKIKHDEAKEALERLDIDIVDAGIVTDDTVYSSAKDAVDKLRGEDISSILVCIAGWIPTHAVIRVTDEFRHLPMIIWGLCGWRKNGRIVTTAGQAGTTALRPAFEAQGYRFKYVYSVIDMPEPTNSIKSFVMAAHAAKYLRKSSIGSMGYADMLLYGTQYEVNSLRRQIGPQVEVFEMLEMVQNLDSISEKEVSEYKEYIKETWKFEMKSDEKVVETGIKYALAVGKKIKERGYSAVTLNDVDGMKKLLGFPPAMVFMLLDNYFGVQTTPENDVLGNVTQLMMKLATGQDAHYMEYYEFFNESMLIGVPDYITKAATKGDIRVLPAAFGKLSSSLLNVSKAKDGYVTCARLIYKNDGYYMHIYTGEAKQPPAWEEYGWDDPSPHLPSLEVFPDNCSVPEFAQKVSSQHVIICYGDHYETLCDLCGLLGVKVI